MCQFHLAGEKVAQFIVEKEAFEGVRRIAKKVCEDILLVSDQKPQLNEEVDKEAYMIIVGTWRNSPLLEVLSKEGNFEGHLLEGKREVFTVQLIEKSSLSDKPLLVIAGSDKRGTIYGLFSVSERIGVTPYVYWGDVKPKTYKKIIFKNEGKMITKCDKTSEVLVAELKSGQISKEPSVKYRGFFINDEWPCFGNWTFSHFGGFNAQMYDKVFELLLRLKGNYLWPAMWTSSFALDGPGEANAELADIYGVVIGNSHHEPCLRASEEWDIYKGEDTPYGTEWNYATNKQGLLNYWEDGLKRSGKYESLITIGMRGERDSSMLGEEATLKENIDLLKDIITEQRQLIKQHVDKALENVAQLLVLYKEVEVYFYGDEETPGLKEWDELEGVTLMLCEDNFGNMRTLPQADNRDREGGWGMYYHFDYHGAPISYEWVNSTPLTKVWEQMSMAYDYGVREVWIVNVGDLKFNEFPLGYFMNLAYDFETWGTKAPNKTALYTKEWVAAQFGSWVDEETVEEMSWVIKEYTKLNHLRRPEALNAEIYHPAHFNEADRMLQRVEKLEEKVEELLSVLPEKCKSGYYSMIYFPAAASSNLLKMHLCAGINQLYAKQGRVLTNEWAAKVEACIKKDKALAEAFSKAFEGKWAGMERAHHIGFTNWNDQDYRYPIKCYIEPATEPRLVVVKKGTTQVYTSSYFTNILEVNDFLSPGCETVTLELINGGVESYSWQIADRCEWLRCSAYEGTIMNQSQIHLSIKWDELHKVLEEGQDKVVTHFLIKAGNEKVEVMVTAKKHDLEKIPVGTFIENQGVITIEAEHYIGQIESDKGTYIKLEDYGKYLSGMKAYPTTAIFEENGPALNYQIWLEEAGVYWLEIQSAPSNPVINKGNLRLGLIINNEEKVIIKTIPEGFRGGDPGEVQWCQGVLDNNHSTRVQVRFNQGFNQIILQAIDAVLVLERLLIYKEANEPKASYLGPVESYSILK